MSFFCSVLTVRMQGNITLDKVANCSTTKFATIRDHWRSLKSWRLGWMCGHVIWLLFVLNDRRSTDIAVRWACCMLLTGLVFHLSTRRSTAFLLRYFLSTLEKIRENTECGLKLAWLADVREPVFSRWSASKTNFYRVTWYVDFHPTPWNLADC